VIDPCGATENDCGHTHHNSCYCHEDQGSGYTYGDEYGDCAFCAGEFTEGQVICADEHNELRVCPGALQ